MNSKRANTSTLISLAIGGAVASIFISPPLIAQEPVAEFEFGDQRVHSLVFSPDGKLLAAGNFRGKLRVWDVAERKEIQTISAHALRVVVLQFLDGGKSLVSVDNDGDVKAWDVSTWKSTNTFPSAATYAGGVSPDGKHLVIGSLGKASGFDLASGQVVRQQFAHDTFVGGVAFSPDGSLLVTASENSVKLWDFAKGQEVAALPSPGGDLKGLAMTSDGKFLAAGTGETRVQIWDVEQRKALKQLALDPGDSVDSVACSPDNATLAVGHNGDLRLFDIASGKETKKWKSAVSEQLAYSPDGSLLASAGMTVESAGKVQVWTVAEPVLKRGSDTADTAPQPGDRPADPTSAVRVWTTADGKYKIRASLVRVEGDQAYLKREIDRKEIGVQIDLLSEQDRELLRGQ